MAGHDPARDVAQNYRAFAAQAHGRSPAYESLTMAVADDAEVLAYLATVPRRQQQPNLLLAAARFLLDDVPTITSLRQLVVHQRDELTQVLRTRRTQTNEPARCATLLPALSLLPQPLALLEVGASAGLTLLVDRYSYDYAGHRLVGTDPAAPVLVCEPRGPVPIPQQIPTVSWRAGLDLNPLDVDDPADMHWLSCLLWPGEGEREARLTSAVQVARRDPPTVHRGNLLEDLPAVAATAPPGATLVVYHSAVLAYVDEPGRRAFADTVRELGAVWLANEAVGVLPGVKVPAHDGAPFVLVRDGRTSLAFTDPHGTWLRWLD